MKKEHSKEKDGDPNSSTSLSSSSDSSSDSSSADEESSSKSGSAKGYGRKKNKQKKDRGHKKNKQAKSELAKAYGKFSNPNPNPESSSEPDIDTGSNSSSESDTDTGSNSSSELDSNSNSNSDSNSDSEQDSESGSASNSLHSNSENDSTEYSSSEDSATPAVYCIQVKNEITRTLFPCVCTQMCNKNQPCKTNKGRLLLCYYSENKKPTLKAPDFANNEHSEDPIQEMLKGGEKWKTFMKYGMSSRNNSNKKEKKKVGRMAFSIVENMGLSNNNSCIYIDACFSDDHRLIFSHGKPAEVAGARIYTNTFGPVKEFTLRRIGGPQIQKTQLLPNYYFLCAFTKND